MFSRELQAVAPQNLSKELPKEYKDELRYRFQDRVHFGVSLAPLTSLRIGGAADILVLPKNHEEILTTIRWCQSAQQAYRVVGGGTNLLVPDEGFHGLVLLTTEHMNNYQLEKNISGETLLYSDAGVRVSRLLSFCLEHKFSGLEFAAGIPGTFGGVIWMNAGTRGGSVDRVLTAIDIVTDAGELRTLTRAQLNYTYRSANLPRRTTVLGGRVRLTPGDTQAIANEIARIKAYRQGQPLRWPNAGSIFKNPPGDYAGRLIEACGLKGKTTGGAMISLDHANFIINVGGARAADVLSLIELAQSTVHQKYGILLATELEVLR